MIDLSRVRNLLKEAGELVEELDGQRPDDREAIEGMSQDRRQQWRAGINQDMNLLASRLELAAALVRNEYWFSKGESDPLDEQRTRSSREA